jgi:hypothetical protein
MLYCNMKDSVSARLALQDVLAALWHARRAGDVGRLAQLGDCEVQRWARARCDDVLTAHARALLTDCPYRNREEFMFTIDRLIDEVEYAHVQLVAYDRYPVNSVHVGPSPGERQASSPAAP